MDVQRIGVQLAAAVLAATALAAAGVTGAHAYTPVRVVPPAPAVQRPVVLPTVDHPSASLVGSYDNGSRAQNLVGLTFDADMTPGMLRQLQAGAVASWYNRDVRETLAREHVAATVFLTGLWAETYPQEAAEMARDPLIEIGSHTYDHAAFRVPCFGLAAAGDRAWELDAAQQAIRRITGVTPRLLRFPGDCYDASDVQLAGSAGLSVVSGDIRGGDGFYLSAASISSLVLARLQPGSIVILHLHGGPNAPMTAPALRTIIAGARARGLEFGTVSQVLGLAPAAAPAAAAAQPPAPAPNLQAAPPAPPANPQAVLVALRPSPAALENGATILRSWRCSCELKAPPRYLRLAPPP